MRGSGGRGFKRRIVGRAIATQNNPLQTVVRAGTVRPMNDNHRSIIGSGYVVAVQVTKDVRPASTMTLELGLQSSRDAPGPISRIVFEGVRDLTFGDLDAQLFCHMGVEDIRDWGLEGVRYTVADAEGEVVSFKCARWRTLA